MAAANIATGCLWPEPVSPHPEPLLVGLKTVSNAGDHLVSSAIDNQYPWRDDTGVGSVWFKPDAAVIVGGEPDDALRPLSPPNPTPLRAREHHSVIAYRCEQ